ncbi:MAG: glycosyltransferase family 39 protein [Opitutaceae bacterium]
MFPHRRLLFGLLLLVSALGLRAPFLARTIWNVDEGITVTAAERILAGGVLYRDIADQRAPLVPYLKAGILAVFGHWNTTAIHAVLAVTLGMAALGIWQIGRRLGNERAGMFAAAVFTVLCFLLPSAEDALAAHTEWFLLFFSVAGFLVLAEASRRPSVGRGALAGALFGLATLSKQPGVLDWAVALVLVGLLLGAAPRERRREWWLLGGGLVAGLVIVVAVAIGYLIWRGAGADARYYAWTYNNQIYVPAVPLARRWATMIDPFSLAAQHAPVVFALGLVAAAALPVAAVRGWRRTSTVGLQLLPRLALGWTAAGIVACSLSGRSFSHYSIQVIPGLSLACGVVLASAWDWCAARGRWPQFAAIAAVVCAVGDAGGRIERRIASMDRHDYEWTARMEAVRSLTKDSERVFFWGFTPDCYVHARRLPATRFVYTTFLTGMVPWTNVDPLIETAALVTPGSWDRVREDFACTPPAVIIDTGSVRHQNKYPLQDQPWLWELVTRDYAEVRLSDPERHDFRFYRRLEETIPDARALAAAESSAVRLRFEVPAMFHSAARLVVEAPAGATRLDLYGDGVLLRSLGLRDGRADVAFPLRMAELGDVARAFTVVANYPAGPAASAPVRLTRTEVLRACASAAGPSIRLLERELRPLASETRGGAPARRPDTPENWQTPATARLLYARPAGLRAFILRFGVDPDTYYDRPGWSASDGVDFVVDYRDHAAAVSRLFTRRLYPKIREQDCGLQTAQIELPNTGEGQIQIRVLSGPADNETRDWAYLQDMIGVGYGPPLAWTGGAIPAERVSAHNDPVMTCDPDSCWTAHSPSSVSYLLPADAQTLSFSYGLQTASYDGSQGGRTDGIGIVVTGELADGTNCTLFERTLAPAEVAADRGRQTARVDLQNRRVRRVTIAIGPGPNGNFSYDWSYLADLRLEAEAVAVAP